MPASRNDIRSFLYSKPASILVEVTGVAGSTPRDTDAWMLVSDSAIFSTIGGGQLEYMAIDEARRALRAGLSPKAMDVPLGPEIGQCCGGRVALSFRLVDRDLAGALVARCDASLAARPHVYVFGAGHVGDALAVSLALAPLKVMLVETRAEALAQSGAENVETCLTAMPETVVRDAPAGSSFVILTHDHALDFLIAAEALKRADAAYVGMIGSKTKRATFQSWLARETGRPALIEALTCPIGGPLRDKRPAVIATLSAAEILTAALVWQGRNEDAAADQEAAAKPDGVPPPDSMTQ